MSHHLPLAFGLTVTFLRFLLIVLATEDFTRIFSPGPPPLAWDVLPTMALAFYGYQSG